MPIYEFQCGNCGARKEVIAKITETVEPPSCDTGTKESDPTHCDSAKMVRIITTTTFILKGDCWARDGYKK